MEGEVTVERRTVKFSLIFLQTHGSTRKRDWWTGLHFNLNVSPATIYVLFVFRSFLLNLKANVNVKTKA